MCDKFKCNLVRCVIDLAYFNLMLENGKALKSQT